VRPKNNQFGGHNAALKTCIRISSSYFWPKMYTDILKHTKMFLRCQQRKKSTDMPPFLQPLPTPDKPNVRIHAELFGPMLTAGWQHKYILCITDSSTQWSRQWRTKKPRQWQKPFSLNGFVNSASQRRFTLMAGRSLSTSSQTSYSRYLM
jgi:Integrase zinc binding domain